MTKYWIYIFLAVISTCGCSSTNQERPNVILIITDDQGYGDIGAHGNPLIKTPHMDQLYAESIRFTNFHVSPTCSPTRAALMTGRYTNRTGAWHTIGGWSLLRSNEKTLGNLFSEGGYVTGAFGKWHLGDNYPFRAKDRGFQSTVVHGGGGVQQTPDYWGNDYFDDTYFYNGKPKQYEGYCTDVFFDEAMSFIRQSKDQPFFCYISTNAPHSPFNVPPSYLDLYEGIPDTILANDQKRFYGMISNIDENIGRLRASLVEQNIADNTLLIFMSDNGTAAGYRSREGRTMGFNSNMRGTKNSPYEGGHRVPFYVYWKDGKVVGGKDISTLAAHIDIMPTLAEWCKLKLPENHLPIDGRSLVPLVEGNNLELKNRILITDSQRKQVPEKWTKTAVMSRNWRLVNGEELYNLDNDPGQEFNLFKDQKMLVDTLREAYDDWWSSMEETFQQEP
ncbi:MAG: arylsulfatase, partial [Bacteroidota bacterium]